MSEIPAVNACRPGFGASCCLCCGSHNYDAPYARLHELFRERSALMQNFSRGYVARLMTSSRSPMTGSYYFDRQEDFLITLPARFARSVQCPFTGYDEPGSPILGCLLHPGEQDGSAVYDCFRNYRSKIFTCASKESLSDAQILFAAELFQDWYYYSLLISDVSLLSRLEGEGKPAGEVPGTRKEEVRKELDLYLQSRGDEIFRDPYFS